MKKLYVGNLAWAVTDEDLQETFAEHGSVGSATVITERDSGRSRGFGFVEMEDGVATGLTPLGQTIKDTVIFAMQEFGRLLAEIIVMVKDMTGEGRDFTGMITLMTMPLRLAVKLLGAMGPNLLETILLFKMMSGVMPVMNAYLAINTLLIEKNMKKAVKQYVKNIELSAVTLQVSFLRVCLLQ